MGWASGTDIFDSVMDAVIDYIPIDKVSSVMEKVAEALWEGDWDTENESKYYFPYLLDIMHDRGFVDDEEYEAAQSFR